MTIKYITDSLGNTTDVMIPIDEWNHILLNHKDINDRLMQLNDNEIPTWHKDIVENRIKNAKDENYKDWRESRKRIRL